MSNISVCNLNWMISLELVYSNQKSLPIKWLYSGREKNCILNQIMTQIPIVVSNAIYTMWTPILLLWGVIWLRKQYWDFAYIWNRGNRFLHCGHFKYDFQKISRPLPRSVWKSSVFPWRMVMVQHWIQVAQNYCWNISENLHHLQIFAFRWHYLCLNTRFWNALCQWFLCTKKF